MTYALTNKVGDSLETSLRSVRVIADFILKKFQLCLVMVKLIPITQLITELHSARRIIKDSVVKESKNSISTVCDSTH